MTDDKQSNDQKCPSGQFSRAQKSLLISLEGYIEKNGGTQKRGNEMKCSTQWKWKRGGN